MSVKKEKPTSAPKPEVAKPKPKINTTVYLSNLSYKRDETGIKKLMTRYGHIKKIKIVIDLETEQSKGMAFIEMKTVEQAKAAIAGLNGEIIDGRTLKASWAIPQDKPFFQKFNDSPSEKKFFKKTSKKTTKKLTKKVSKK